MMDKDFINKICLAMPEPVRKDKYSQGKTYCGRSIREMIYLAGRRQLFRKRYQIPDETSDSFSVSGKRDQRNVDQDKEKSKNNEIFPNSPNENENEIEEEEKNDMAMEDIKQRKVNRQKEKQKVNKWLVNDENDDDENENDSSNTCEYDESQRKLKKRVRSIYNDDEKEETRKKTNKQKSKEKEVEVKIKYAFIGAKEKKVTIAPEDEQNVNEEEDDPEAINREIEALIEDDIVEEQKPSENVKKHNKVRETSVVFENSELLSNKTSKSVMRKMANKDEISDSFPFNIDSESSKGTSTLLEKLYKEYNISDVDSFEAECFLDDENPFIGIPAAGVYADDEGEEPEDKGHFSKETSRYLKDNQKRFFLTMKRAKTVNKPKDNDEILKDADSELPLVKLLRSPRFADDDDETGSNVKRKERTSRFLDPIDENNKEREEMRRKHHEAFISRKMRQPAVTPKVESSENITIQKKEINHEAVKAKVIKEDDMDFRMSHRRAKFSNRFLNDGDEEIRVVRNNY